MEGGTGDDELNDTGATESALTATDNTGNDLLDGGEGKDKLTSTTGEDTLVGGAGLTLSWVPHHLGIL